MKKIGRNGSHADLGWATEFRPGYFYCEMAWNMSHTLYALDILLRKNITKEPTLQCWQGLKLPITNVTNLRYFTVKEYN